MEKTIKEADDEKRKALERARRLHLVEYKPLREQLQRLRESVGLFSVNANNTAATVESFEAAVVGDEDDDDRMHSIIEAFLR